MGHGGRVSPTHVPNAALGPPAPAVVCERPAARARARGGGGGARRAGSVARRRRAREPVPGRRRVPGAGGESTGGHGCRRLLRGSAHERKLPRTMVTARVGPLPPPLPPPPKTQQPRPGVEEPPL